MNAVRKRLLYDLPLIPAPQAVEGSVRTSYPELRVIWNGTLMEVVAVHGAVTVGHADDADIVVDESVWREPRHELLSVRDGRPLLTLHPALTGRVYTARGSREVAEQLAEYGTEIELEPGCGAVLEFGPITVAIRMTGRERVRPVPFWERIDTAVVALFTLVFATGLMLMNAIIETPPIEVDFLVVRDVDGGVIHLPPLEEEVEKVEPVKKVILKVKEDGLHDAMQARKALGDEGRVGKKTSRVANAVGSSRASLDDKVAQSTGIMGALSMGAASFDRVFGGGGLGAGLEKTLGSVTGLSGTDQFGSGGLGVRGFATGGGGNALAIGGLNTRGKGGNGSTMGYGMKEGRIGGKELSQIAAGGGGAVIMGAIDRAVVDAYIRRHLAQIRWCYEKELSKNPTLFGKVLISFIIAKSGQVSTSRSLEKRSTIGSPAVESCVAAAIKKIRFPEPKGGGTVTVNYPFVFKNAVN